MESRANLKLSAFPREIRGDVTNKYGSTFKH